MLINFQIKQGIPKQSINRIELPLKLWQTQQNNVDCDTMFTMMMMMREPSAKPAHACYLVFPTVIVARQIMKYGKHFYVNNKTNIIIFIPFGNIWCALICLCAQHTHTQNLWNSYSKESFLPKIQPLSHVSAIISLCAHNRNVCV